MKIQIIKGDITEMEVSIIVNAANSSLLGGGGVDGAIHRKGGSAILEACRGIRNRQGGCKVGEAVSTPAGNLKANYVVHTVGPKYHANTPEIKLREQLLSCYDKSMQLAVQLSATSIAFPNISTGIYSYPKPKAAKEVLEWFDAHKKSFSSIQEVCFVCFDEENYQLYKETYKKYIK